MNLRFYAFLNLWNLIVKKKKSLKLAYWPHLYYYFHSDCGKVQTRKTPTTKPFYAVDNSKMTVWQWSLANHGKLDPKWSRLDLKEDKYIKLKLVPLLWIFEALISRKLQKFIHILKSTALLCKLWIHSTWKFIPVKMSFFGLKQGKYGNFV